MRQHFSKSLPMLIAIVGFALSLLVGNGVRAQEPPAQSAEQAAAEAITKAKAEARSAYKKIETESERIAPLEEAMYEELGAAIKAMDGEELDKATALITAKYTKLFAEVEKAILGAADGFIVAFKKVDESNWDAKADADIFDEGFLRVADDCLIKKDLTGAIAAYQTLMRRSPDAETRTACGAYFLPSTLLLLSDYAAAQKQLEALVKEADKDAKDIVREYLGDLAAVNAMPVAAIAAWKAALKEIPEKLEEEDPRLSIRESLEHKIRHTGKEAYALNSKDWIGAEPTTLAKLKGKIVILDFWATWCVPCLTSIPELHDFYTANKAKGVEVIGVTEHYTDGYIAPDMDDLREDGAAGEVTEDMDEKECLAHLKTFHANIKCSYPFLVAAPAESAAYEIQSYPTLMILDHKGKIAVILVGAGNQALLEHATKNLLKAQAAEEAKKAAEEAEKKAAETR